jgi:endonuclease YncB( thermonuclease family)
VFAVGAIFLVGWASETRLSLPNLRPKSAPVTANFGYCHVGGGTNCVVDGDTFWLGGVDIRIADIDTPETHEYHCPAELALGNRATERLHALLESGPITLQPIDRDEDVYGRKLRLVFVNGQSVGETLIGEGLAHRYVRGKLPWC